MPDYPQEFVTWQFLANGDLEVTSWEECTMKNRPTPTKSRMSAPKSELYANLRTRLENLNTMPELASCISVLTVEVERLSGLIHDGMTPLTSSSSAASNYQDQQPALTSTPSTPTVVPVADIAVTLLHRLKWEGHGNLTDMPTELLKELVEQLEWSLKRRP